MYMYNRQSCRSRAPSIFTWHWHCAWTIFFSSVSLVLILYQHRFSSLLIVCYLPPFHIQTIVFFHQAILSPRLRWSFPRQTWLLILRYPRVSLSLLWSPWPHPFLCSMSPTRALSWKQWPPVLGHWRRVLLESKHTSNTTIPYKRRRRIPWRSVKGAFVHAVIVPVWSKPRKIVMYLALTTRACWRWFAENQSRLSSTAARRKTHIVMNSRWKYQRWRSFEGMLYAFHCYTRRNSDFFFHWFVGEY